MISIESLLMMGKLFKLVDQIETMVIK
jgi:hypothetical protein